MARWGPGNDWGIADGRRRLTREESHARTRELLLESASRLFAELGVEATPVEAIAEHAGFSRGAFYSNFANKDELVVSLIQSYTEAHLAQSEEIAAAASSSGTVLFQALFERAQQRRLDRPWEALLFIEFWLYAARNPTLLPTLQKRVDSRVKLIEKLVIERFERMGIDSPAAPDHVAAAVLAIDEGVSLLSMIDPDRYPRTAFFEVLTFLEGVMTGAPPVDVERSAEA